MVSPQYNLLIIAALNMLRALDEDHHVVCTAELDLVTKELVIDQHLLHQ